MMKLGLLRYSTFGVLRFVIRLFSRSHAPAWECLAPASRAPHEKGNPTYRLR
ncbi:hypothetical protein KAR48_10420 [bacterium]|nr:hypothetical protein [bacterium]